jgi:hypothetical protein
MGNLQGKRKEQVDFSEKMVVYSIAGIAILISILSIYNFIKSVINE